MSKRVHQIAAAEEANERARERLARGMERVRRNLARGAEVVAAQNEARRNAVMGLKGSLAQVGAGGSEMCAGIWCLFWLCSNGQPMLQWSAHAAVVVGPPQAEVGPVAGLE